MSRFRDTGVQTLPEDDDVFDISPTSTLQRGSLTLPTSPEHQQGIFKRFRNSFSNLRKKDLKGKIRDCEEEIARLNAELQIAVQGNNDVNVRLASMLETNPFNIYISGSRNIHVGDSNTLVQNSDTKTMVGDLEELTGKLTAAVQENTRERTFAEMKLKNTEVLLKEMKESLQMCTSMLDQNDVRTTRDLGQLKQMLESLTTDRSDDRVIKDGIDRLRHYAIEQKRIVRTADNLPWAMQEAMTRLVNKFGDVSWQKFAEMVEVNVSAIQTRGENEETDGEQTTKLSRDTCARILAQWITQSVDNTGDKLVNIVKEFDRQLSQEMTETFQKKTIASSLIPTVVSQNAQNPRSSMALSDTSTGSYQSMGMRRVPSQQLPDHRSQFEHQLEAWKLQEEMNAKLDKMLALMTEENPHKKKEVNKLNMDDDLYRKVFEEGHFV